MTLLMNPGGEAAGRGALLIALLLAACARALAAPPVTDALLEPLTSAFMRAVRPGEQAELHRDLFKAVLERVQRSHALEVDLAPLLAIAMKEIELLPPHSGEPAEVFRKSINAALALLDPHTRYLDPRAHSRERSIATGDYGGIGLQVEPADGLVRVVAPTPDSPAARAGLRKGDLIVRVGDEPVLGMALSDAIDRMRGEPGTSIALTIRRAGQEAEFTVSIVRERIRPQLLHWRMESDVLVLRPVRFAGPVPAALAAAITDATERGPRGVVLDLRGNPGGLFRQAVTIADYFLAGGVIVSLRGRAPATSRTWQANSAELLAGLPMVVLIDSRTASAAELVAAALQENGRAIVIGARSFGKGSIQATHSLGPEKGALRLTTAIYHGPSGRSVQRTGVVPDIEVVGSPRAAAGDHRREADRPSALPATDEPPPPRAKVEEYRCTAARAHADGALACALAFLDAGDLEAFLASLGDAGSRSSVTAGGGR